MKKLSLSLAAIGLFFATTSQAQETETTTEVQTEVTTTVEKDYEKIEVSELPEAVSTAITRDYPVSPVEEAWVKEKEDKKIYKLKLTGQEDHVYADADGNWIDKDENGIE